jgi:hypothetical protein
MTKEEGIGSQTRIWYDGSCGIGGREGRIRYVYGTKYYYNMSAINDTTQHTTQKKNPTPHDVGDVSAVSGHCVGKTRRHVFKTNF